MSSPTPSKPGEKRTILQSTPVPQLPGWESRLVLLEYPLGIAAPVHNHPVAGIGYVLEGDVISQWEGKEEKVYTKGDSFVDLETTMHIRSENTNKDGWLKILISYVIKVGEPNVNL